MLKLEADKKALLADTLKQAEKKSTQAHFLHRLHCVQLVAQGQSTIEVARWFNDDPSSVARWVRYFKQFGTEGLHDKQKPGRPRKLDPDQLRSLTRDTSQNPAAHGYHHTDSWSGKLLANHIETIYGQSLGIRQCQRLLLQLQENAEIDS